MKRALISVSDKDGVAEFARELFKLNFEIISTGNTYELIKKNGIDVIKVEDFTKFPEMFNGRIKTISPFIHGGILYDRDNSEHIKTAKDNNIQNIDLVCINFYPFSKTIQNTDNFDEIIENIDIGGPSLLRAAAKNFKSIIAITDIKDYKDVISALKSGKVSLEYKKELMIKAYESSANYDVEISNYMNKRFKNSFGDKYFIAGKKVLNTSYGENPHQQGALYEFKNYFSKNIKEINKKPSFNNLLDMNSAFKIASCFKNSACVIKHTNPCGFAIDKDIRLRLKKSLLCDKEASFGGVLAINGIIDEEAAKDINKIFFEVVIGSRITKEAVNVFKNKKRIKLFEQNLEELYIDRDFVDFKHIEGGFIIQNSDRVGDKEICNSQLKSIKKATKKELEDLEIAYKIVSLTKSNSVVLVKDKTMIAVGMGLTSRVDAVRFAIAKAKKLNIDIEGSSMASEAFFPFRDSIDIAAGAGVKAIITPGGSIRDEEVIRASNEHGIPLYFSGIRHFLH